MKTKFKNGTTKLMLPSKPLVLIFDMVGMWLRIARSGDYIILPYRHQFTLPEYYETAFHELTHWTEHPTRLNCGSIATTTTLFWNYVLNWALALSPLNSACPLLSDWRTTPVM